jgi:hypothetical protein
MAVGVPMEQRTNAKLYDMRIKNDCHEYSQETFDIIYNILLERGDYGSPQTEQVEIEKGNNKLTLGGFFSFQYLISSKLSQSSYIIGAFAVSIVCWIIFMKNPLLVGILSIIIGNLLWRLACEMAIIIFRMNEQLGSIHQEVKQTINKQIG